MVMNVIGIFLKITICRMSLVWTTNDGPAPKTAVL